TSTNAALASIAGGEGLLQPAMHSAKAAALMPPTILLGDLATARTVRWPLALCPQPRRPPRRSKLTNLAACRQYSGMISVLILAVVAAGCAGAPEPEPFGAARGFIDFDGHHMFYDLFPADQDPTNRPRFVVW